MAIAIRKLSFMFSLCVLLTVNILSAEETATELNTRNLKKESTKSLFADFVSEDWDRVFQASNELKRRPQQAIPQLISLLESEKRVQLKDTADLIYPGSKKFYGHGFLLSYDLDCISARAGWLIEEITFHDFGFTVYEWELPPKEKSEFEKTVAKWNMQRRRSVATAKTWWKKQMGWNRYEELLKALRSDDSKRVLKALTWIINSEISIKGVTRDKYIDEIYPEIQRLAESKDEALSKSASALVQELKDGDWYWFQLKYEK